MKATIDDARWPIVLIKFPLEWSLDEVDEFGQAMQELVRHRGPMVTIADISAVGPAAVSATIRHRVAELADEIARMDGFIAEIVVAHSTIKRGVVTAYGWLRSRKSHPFHVVGDLHEALVVARRHIEARERAG